MKVAWNRLIRFEATDGRVLNGEPILPSEDFDIGHVTEKDGLTAKVITGIDIYNDTGDTTVSDEVVTVKRLLGPLVASDVPILRCVGLNYAKHSKHLYSFSLSALRQVEISVAKNVAYSQGGRQIPSSFPLHLFQA